MKKSLHSFGDVVKYLDVFPDEPQDTDDGSSLIWDKVAGAYALRVPGGGGSPSGPAGGVLSGTYPNPGFAVDMTTQAELDAHVAAADPHTGYRLESAPIAVGDLAFDPATQAELDAHVAAADPHIGYQKESERNIASGYAGLAASGFVAPAQLGSGSDGTDHMTLTAAGTYVQQADFTGAWSSGTNYVLNDIVKRSGFVFIASQASGPAGVGAKDPLTQSAYWDVFSGATSSYIRLKDYHNIINGFAVGTYISSDINGAPMAAGSSSAFAAAFYLDPADYVVPSSLALYLRVRLRVHVNNVAPAASYQAGLYPFTAPAGGAAAVTGTLGAVVSGSQPSVITTPAANSSTVSVGADFAFPAAGDYVLGIVQTGGTMAANSACHLGVSLEWRIV